MNTAPHLIPLSQVKKNAKVQASRDTIETCKGLKNKLKSTNSLICYVENMRNYYEDRVPTATSRRTSQFNANRGQLRKFNNKIGKATSPTCRFCMLEPEDNNHVLCTCPAIRTERAEARQLPTSFCHIIHEKQIARQFFTPDPLQKNSKQ